MRSPLDPPRLRRFEVVTVLPDRFRRRRRTDWADRNMHGLEVDCFLEGPCLDRNGALHVVDIPFGRIFRIDGGGGWSPVAEYDGWPNGMKALEDGTLLVADQRRGLVAVDPAAGDARTLCAGHDGRPFLGLNDLTLAAGGAVHFTDQGQSGLHDPSGRLFRYCRDGSLDLLLAGIPSPNGLVLAADGRTLFLAVTRANAVWRVPLTPSGGVTKAGLFVQLSGGIGPDGLALTPDGGLLVCHPGLGVWRLDPSGIPTDLWHDPRYGFPTNLVRNPGAGERYWVTESMTGTILEIDLGSATGDGA